MKSGLGTQAYTIVEVLIVLAVTSMLLVSGLLVVGGQQAKTQFNEATRDTRSRIDSIINNVSTGYYTRRINFTCNDTANGPRFSSTSKARGTNQGCIFIGRAMHFGVNGKPSDVNVYNLVGLGIIGTSTTPLQPLLDLPSARPVAMAKGTINTVGAPDQNDYVGLSAAENIESSALNNGLAIKSMSYKTDSTSPDFPTSVVAFVTDFPTLSTIGNLNGSRTALLYAIDYTSTGTTRATWTTVNKTQAVDSIDNATSAGKPYFVPTAANGVNFKRAYSVTMCFEGGTDKYAIITIGGASRQLNTELEIKDGACP